MTSSVSYAISRRRGAFTLIELLVVILIIAVAAGIVVPAYKGFWQRAQFTQVASNVQSLFAYARSQAVGHDDAVTVIYDPGSRTFSVSYTTPTPLAQDSPVALEAASAQNNVTAPAAQAVRTVSLESGYDVTNFVAQGGSASGASASGGSIRFYGDGSADPAQFTLVSADGESSVMSLLPASGRLRLE